MKNYVVIMMVVLAGFAGCSGDAPESKGVGSEPISEKSIDEVSVDSVEAEVVAEVFAESDSFLYTNYSKEGFDSFEGAKVLFVGSSSCGSCVSKHEALASDEGLSGRVFRVEFSDVPSDLKKEFGITSYDTFYFIGVDGEVEKKAGIPKEDLLEMLSSEVVMYGAAEDVYKEDSEFSYVEYEKESFDSFEGDKVLFVASSTCGACGFKHDALTDSEGLKGKVFRVEFDAASLELKKEFGITSYDTLYFIGADGSVEKKVGMLKEDLVEKLS
jgi:hypothetical protein